MIKGQKIIDVREQTEEEMEELGWYKPAVVIVLENGTELFASKDDEGNDSGVIFTKHANGDEGYLLADKNK